MLLYTPLQFRGKCCTFYSTTFILVNLLNLFTFCIKILKFQVVLLQSKVINTSSTFIIIFTQVLCLSTILRYLYFTFLLLYTSTPLQFRGKCCTFYSTTFILVNLLNLFTCCIKIQNFEVVLLQSKVIKTSSTFISLH